MHPALRHITADRGDVGWRIDLVLRRHLSDVPSATRTRVQRWIEDGRVAVNGLIVRRVSTRAGLNDTLTIDLPAETARALLLPESRPLEILFEDDHLLVVNKPPGLVSHPTYRHPDGTLMNALLGYAATWAPGQRPSLVGRLDKLTSGCVLVAKSTTAHARLQRAMAIPAAEKVYLAVVCGCVEPPSGDIDLPLARDPQDRRRVVVSADRGIRSLTRYARISATRVGPGAVSLLECRLVTGRTHQIRVHLAARGWPIVGDPQYGDACRVECLGDNALSVLRAFPRQALHATRVGFAHPFTGTVVSVAAPLAPDMRTLTDALGLDPARPSSRASARPAP